MKLPQILFCLTMLSFFASLVAAQPAIEIELGDFRFRPDEIRVPEGVTVTLELSNTDAITPHDFVLEIPETGTDLRIDVPPGKTVTFSFTTPASGVYPFYCSKRFLFFKSHRERGMEGRLIVLPGSGRPTQ